jgi:hypothetical protein
MMISIRGDIMMKRLKEDAEIQQGSEGMGDIDRGTRSESGELYPD